MRKKKLYVMMDKNVFQQIIFVMEILNMEMVTEVLIALMVQMNSSENAVLAILKHILKNFAFLNHVLIWTINFNAILVIVFRKISFVMELTL